MAGDTWLSYTSSISPTLHALILLLQHLCTRLPTSVQGLKLLVYKALSY
jgi:hypothetical protein